MDKARVILIIVSILVILLLILVLPGCLKLIFIFLLIVLLVLFFLSVMSWKNDKQGLKTTSQLIPKKADALNLVVPEQESSYFSFQPNGVPQNKGKTFLPLQTNPPPAHTWTQPEKIVARPSDQHVEVSKPMPLEMSITPEIPETLKTIQPVLSKSKLEQKLELKQEPKQERSEPELQSQSEPRLQNQPVVQQESEPASQNAPQPTRPGSLNAPPPIEMPLIRQPEHRIVREPAPCGALPSIVEKTTNDLVHHDTIVSRTQPKVLPSCQSLDVLNPCPVDVAWEGQFANCPPTFIPRVGGCEIAPRNNQIWVADLNPLIAERAVIQGQEWDFYKHFGARDKFIQFISKDMFAGSGTAMPSTGFDFWPLRSGKTSDPYTRPIPGGDLDATYCSQMKITNQQPKYTDF